MSGRVADASLPKMQLGQHAVLPLPRGSYVVTRSRPYLDAADAYADASLPFDEIREIGEEAVDFGFGEEHGEEFVDGGDALGEFVGAEGVGV